MADLFMMMSFTAAQTYNAAHFNQEQVLVNRQIVPVGEIRQLRSRSKPRDTTAFEAGVRRGTALGHV